jgi:hypothetical protein
MNVYEHPQDIALVRAREAFAEVALTEALLQPGPKTSRRVSASALYRAARDGTAVDEEALQSRAARQFFAGAISETATYTLAEARAASSGGPAARHGEGCHIRFERSRAEPNQYFVVVEVERAHAEPSPTSLIVCDREQRCRRFPLPEVRDGIAQIIAEADSDLVRLVGDPATRVYLS